MALDINGNLLSREELELKVLEQERQIDLLNTDVEALSLLSTKLIADIAELKRLMGDDGK